eukprot:CAMPEP_0175022060 /NCGR_PEP_ID=MMETSP0005-20121125/15086_1 /TAXON_ID=420556 /ORGANISM="Ochromonas sp., Strain CCMP1393" /LENGTH=114 /DNA_ID=CAMNT_0016280229 /DNA_START=61 /DNA_END=406 /DNA_ORIENTATION=+
MRTVPTPFINSAEQLRTASGMPKCIASRRSKTASDNASPPSFQGGLALSSTTSTRRGPLLHADKPFYRTISTHPGTSATSKQAFYAPRFATMVAVHSMPQREHSQGLLDGWEAL